MTARGPREEMSMSWMTPFTPDDVTYLLELAAKMERGFYSVNPQWVRDLAEKVRVTLGAAAPLDDPCPGVVVPDWPTVTLPRDDGTTYTMSRCPVCPQLFVHAGAWHKAWTPARTYEDEHFNPR